MTDEANAGIQPGAVQDALSNAEYLFDQLAADKSNPSKMRRAALNASANCETIRTAIRSAERAALKQSMKE